MRVTLRRKITTLTCLAAVVPVIVMLIITTVLEHRLGKTVSEEVRTLITEHVSQVTRDVYEECRNTDQMISGETGRVLDAALTIIERSGGFRVLESQRKWRLPDRQTGEMKTISLPRISLGGGELQVERNPEEKVLPVDSIGDLTGAQCTVFQRINPEGDMLAVASTEVDDEDRRKIGYVKRAMGADGQVDKVIDDVVSGLESSERSEGDYGARLVMYAPLKDQDGFVSGMVGVYMPLSAVENLRKAILRTSVGRTGYVWVIGTRGKYKNKYIISRSGARDGEDLSASQNRELVEDFISTARNAGQGSLSSMKYEWNDADDGPQREKYSVYTYFKPWGWVIGSGVYLDDYRGVKQKLTGTMQKLITLLVVSGLVILAVILGISFYMSGLIANPVSHMVGIARMVAEGNIHEASRAITEVEDFCPNARKAVRNSKDRDNVDETGQLYLAIRDMAQNLDSLVGQVQRSGIQVTTSATEIAASARQLDETVSNQAAATNQISATSLEISANAGELAGTMDEVHRTAEDAAGLAEEGKDGLRSMIRIMDDLSSATDSITQKLASINEQAVSIVYIVTTITKVADRTNLLSLNAAIEAEKAGEFGQGFAVVAGEIRRLADQTSVAALEIEDMISDMREAVDSGVVEMDHFAREVHHGAGKAVKLGRKLDGIMESVTDLNPRIQAVNEGMTAQAEGAQQISQSMTQLSDSASQTSDSLGEFNRAASQLNEAVQGLQNEVSRFKVS